MQRHKTIFLCLILMVAMLLTACGSERHVRDLKKFIDDQKKSAAENQKLSAATQLHFPTPATYEAKNARSPFAEITVAGTIKVHPLENYPLASLKFKGTVTQNDNTLAFILAPDNKLYQVKTGDIIGDHYGKILNIYPDHIEIEESVTEGGTQEVSKRLVTLELRD